MRADRKPTTYRDVFPQNVRPTSKRIGPWDECAFAERVVNAGGCVVL